MGSTRGFWRWVARGCRPWNRVGDFAEWLRRTVGALRVRNKDVPEALAALGLPLLTTNYDDILEQVTNLPGVTWQDYAQAMQRALRALKTPLFVGYGSGFEDPNFTVSHSPTPTPLSTTRTREPELPPTAKAG